MKIKKVILLSTAILLGSWANAQDFLGYNYSNYQTAGGMIFNPASIADSRYRVNVNIMSLNVGLTNNAYQLHNVYFYDFKEEDYSKITDGKTKDLNVNLDVLGPSFMIDLGKKIGSVGFSSRLRVLLSENNLDNEIFKMLGSGGTFDYTKSQKQSDLRLDAHSFAEFGLTYARTVWETQNHVVKAGITGKYIKGLVAGSLRIDDLEVKLNKDVSGLDDDVFDKLRGNITAVYSDGIDKLVNDFDIGTLNSSGNSFGLDLGAEYEWYPKGRGNDTVSKKVTPYLLKVSASITDIGSVSYTPSVNTANYSVNGEGKSISELNDAPSGDSFDDYIEYLKNERFITERGAISKYNMSLPTVLRINVDWNAIWKLYVNFGIVQNLVSSSSFGARYANQAYLTPRVEFNKFVTVYVPFSVSNDNFNWGFGFNFGAFFIGSGSIGSVLASNKIRAFDIHFGFAVPIGKKNR